MASSFVQLTVVGAFFLQSASGDVSLRDQPLWGRNSEVSPLTQNLVGNMSHLKQMLSDILEKRDGDKMPVIMRLIAESPEMDESLLRDFIHDLNEYKLQNTVEATEEEWQSGGSVYSASKMDFLYAGGIIPIIELHYTPEGEAAIIRMTEHPEPQMRLWAATTLGRRGSQQAIPVLRKLISIEKARGADAEIFYEALSLTEARWPSAEGPKTPKNEETNNLRPDIKKPPSGSMEDGKAGSVSMSWWKILIASTGVLMILFVALRYWRSRSVE